MIPYTKLMRMNQEELCAKLRRARWVILGGIGFSGYNEEFNADTGIYRNTIDRKTEIKETQKFEKLYNKQTNRHAKRKKYDYSDTYAESKLVCR